MNDIGNWFSNCPKWLQLAAKQLGEGVSIDDIVSKSLGFCLKEVEREFPNIDLNIQPSSFAQRTTDKLQLCSISEIEGVNSLNPSKPLEFKENNITVVYGLNGSGKSGYVRLLKHICGARNNMKGPLHQNVFTNGNTDQKAKITFQKNQSLEEYKWDGKGVCEELAGIDIFDASFGKIFIDKDGDEARYEPPQLSFFSSLVEICDKVSEKLNDKSRRYQSSMPQLPNELVGSDGGNWFGRINANTTSEAINKYCSFTGDNSQDIHNFQQRLSQQNPQAKANQLKKQKEHVDKIIKDALEYSNQFSDTNCNKIISLQNTYIQKKAASEAAGKIVNGTLLNIGSDEWRELWNAARKYSKEVAYKEQNFPVITDDSVCVLCHQSLSNEAKNRLQSFENYVKSETQKEATAARKKVKQALKALEDPPCPQDLKTQIDAAGIEDKEIITKINHTFTIFRERKDKLISVTSENGLKAMDELTTMPQQPTWINDVENILNNYDKLANKYLEDANQGDQVNLKNQLKNLQAKKWLSEQKQAIQKEIQLHKTQKTLKDAKNLTDTTALSKKKGELSEELITKKFVKRFNNELNGLGAKKIRAKLVKTGTKKGRLLHKLQLDGASHYPLREVLSEGETRIISIASFLADVTGRNDKPPLVFDDPISSLDQNYEEAVVQRLCDLSKERQVIIFTHRLPLLALILEKAKATSEIKTVYINAEEWGTGEPIGIPLFAKSINKVFDSLRGVLQEARKNKQDDRHYIQSFCTDFRIFLERIIEHELLAGVVERYRKDIYTRSINKLVKISIDDCSYLDNLMTKYSKHLHSHSTEAPVQLPTIDELATDFQKLKEWRSEFKDRK